MTRGTGSGGMVLLDWPASGVAGHGDPIPEVELVSASGATYSLRTLANGRPLLLVFGSAECGSCVPVLESLERWQRELGDVTVRLATSSHPKAIRHVAPTAEPFARYGARSARRELGVERTPAALLLGGIDNPVVSSEIAHGLDEINALVERARGLTH